MGTTDGKIGKTNLPTGIQLPNYTPKIEGENEDKSQIEHAMATAISEIKAIDPLSLKEAMTRPDHAKWKAAIQEELENLKKAGI